MDPVTLALLGMLLGGTGLQMSAAKKSANAQAAALNRYSAKKKAQGAEAEALFNQRLAEQDVGAQQEQIDAGAGQKVERVSTMIDQLAPMFDPLLPGSQSANRVVQSQNAGALADAVAKAKAKLKANATLEGFSGRTFDRGLQLGRDADLYRTQASFDRGDQSVLAAEQNAAQFKGAGRAMLGDLLVTGAQIGLMGQGGAGLFGKAGGSATSQAAGTGLSDGLRGLYRGGRLGLV